MVHRALRAAWSVDAEVYLDTEHPTNRIQPKPLAIVASPRLTTHPQTHQTLSRHHPRVTTSSLGAYVPCGARPAPLLPTPAERLPSQPAASLDELELEPRGLLRCAAGDPLGRLERHLGRRIGRQIGGRSHAHRT